MTFPFAAYSAPSPIGVDVALYDRRPVVIGLVGCGVWGANILRDLRLLECDVREIPEVEGGRRDSDRRGNLSLGALKL